MWLPRNTHFAFLASTPPLLGPPLASQPQRSLIPFSFNQPAVDDTSFKPFLHSFWGGALYQWQSSYDCLCLRSHLIGRIYRSPSSMCAKQVTIQVGLCPLDHGGGSTAVVHLVLCLGQSEEQTGKARERDMHVTLNSCWPEAHLEVYAI